MATTSTVIGNGSDTQFDVNAGFNTAKAIARLFDIASGEEVLGFQLERLTPSATSVRLTLTPAPALNAVQVRLSDGTEPP